MTHLLYIFGAGASHGSIPMINEIPDCIKYMAQHLPKPSKQHTEISNLLSKYLNKVDGSQTVDTFAKKLYLLKNISNDRLYEYENFKLETSFIFELFQRCTYAIREGNKTIHAFNEKNKVNERYDVFWASILKENIKDVPKNLTILTWNYDLQLEIAYHDYHKETDIVDSTDLNLGEDIEQRKFKNSIRWLNETNKHVTHLNGMIGIKNKSDDLMKYPTELLERKKIADQQQEILDLYKSYFDSGNDIASLIDYAWDREKNYEIDTDSVMQSASLATHVVFCGYSFPTFNRDFDQRLLFQLGHHNNGVRKVYIQNPQAESLKYKFEELADSVNAKFDVDAITDTTAFHLPPQVAFEY